jgi:acetyl-CoA synthetase
MCAAHNMSDYEATRRSFRFEVPALYNFGFDVIERRARERDKTAFIEVSGDRSRIVAHRFSDLDRAANRFANVLRDLGAAKGDTAIVVLPRSPAWYAVMIGCIKLGVAPIPGTTLLTARDLEYRINRAQAKLVIVGDAHCAKIDEIAARAPMLVHRIAVGGSRAGWIDYTRIVAEASDRLDRGALEPTRADDTMMYYFTSGTTAHPKLVPRAHSYALAHQITGRFWMDLREDDIHWTLSDTGWAKAAWGLLFGPWQMGAASVLYDGPPGFDADAHLRLIGELGVTTFCAPPTIYRLFAQVDLRAYDLRSLRHSFSAGEPLNPEAMRVWKDATGHEVYDGYGQTETVNIVANFPCLPIRPGSMGKPVPGIEVEIVDDDGRILPAGQIGHIAVRLTDPYPPGLFSGYHDDAQANRACFRNGFYYTGDTASRDADGYIWFAGRADDMISSAGYRISPFEVESALIEHPAVAESAVVGKKDPVRGEIVVAFVVLAAGHTPSEALERDIQEFVKRQTAPYKYPREIAFCASLPKTISGKIRRVELRAQANAQTATR